jgi:hypothetical protein
MNDPALEKRGESLPRHVVSRGIKPVGDFKNAIHVQSLSFTNLILDEYDSG